MTRAINEYWFGTLTLENLEEVAEQIRHILTGKYYTFVSSKVDPKYPEYHEIPEVRTGQYMENCSTWYDDPTEHTFGGFHVNDTYGIWGAATDQWHEGYPSIHFEYNTITIEQYSGAGYLCRWVIKVEHHHEHE